MRLFIVCVVFTSVVAAAAGIPVAGELGPWSTTDELLYTDLVVKGVVEFLDGERVPVQAYMPSDPRPDVTIPISVVRLRVLDVLKGSYHKPSLTFVVPGGEPGSPVGLSDMSYDLDVGNQVVLSLVFWKYMKGGMYMLRSDLGRWDKSDGDWVNHAHREVTEGPDAIRAALAPAEPERMFAQADVVVAGKVTNSHMEEQDGVGVDVVTVQVIDAWKGKPGATLTFRAIPRGGMNLAWWRPVPAIETGTEWVFFLKKYDDWYFPFAGTNGLLRIDGDRLIRASATDYGISKPELKKRLTRGRSHERRE